MNKSYTKSQIVNLETGILSYAWKVAQTSLILQRLKVDLKLCRQSRNAVYQVELFDRT